MKKFVKSINLDLFQLSYFKIPGFNLQWGVSLISSGELPIIGMTQNMGFHEKKFNTGKNNLAVP